MHALLYAEPILDCTAANLTLLSAESLINSRFERYNLVPGQFRLAQPWQRPSARASARSLRGGGGGLGARVTTAPQAGRKRRGHRLCELGNDEVGVQRDTSGSDSDDGSNSDGGSGGNSHCGRPAARCSPAASWGEPEADMQTAEQLASHAHAALQHMLCKSIDTALDAAGHAMMPSVMGQQAATAPATRTSPPPAAVFLGAPTDWRALAALQHVMKPRVSLVSPAIAAAAHQQLNGSSRLFGALVTNDSSDEVEASAADAQLLLPPHSGFFMGGLHGLPAFARGAMGCNCPPPPPPPPPALVTSRCHCH